MIEAHAPEPEPVILWLMDRIASHDIVAGLQKLPARALNEPLTRGGGQRAGSSWCAAMRRNRDETIFRLSRRHGETDGY